MHNAPAVTYPVGRSRLQWVLGWGLVSLQGWTWAWWWWLDPAADWPHAAMAILSLLSGLALWRDLSQSQDGLLRWTGQDWHWQSFAGESAVGQTVTLDAPLTVAWDLQSHLVLMGRQGKTVHWFWLQRAAQPALWHALRCAVFARLHPVPSDQAPGPDGLLGDSGKAGA